MNPLWMLVQFYTILFVVAVVWQTIDDLKEKYQTRKRVSK